MAETAVVKLATARALAAAGALQGATVRGQVGGYAVALRIGQGEQVLATKVGMPRLFSQLNRAALLLRNELGLSKFEVDVTHYSPSDMVKRPDRREALLKQTQALAHDAWFRQRVQQTLKDERGYKPLDAVISQSIERVVGSK